MIAGIIFDLDGVLVSTDELHYRSWKKLAEEIGIKDYSIEDNEKQRGISRMNSLEILLCKSTKRYTLAEKKQLSDKKNIYYQELLLSEKSDILLPGVIETLEFLKNKKLKMAIGSSSENAPQIIEKSDIGLYIDACICGTDIKHAKPDPEIFIKAAEAIKIEEKKCMVVEDSKAGIEAAKQAGMKTLGVGRIYNKLNADYCRENLGSIKEWETLLA